MWSTACPDWQERLRAGRPLVPDLPGLLEEPFKSEAATALRVFKRLMVPDMIGTPPLAEACGEWFFAIVAALLGSYDSHSHVRMIQELFALVPKGNSKTSYAALLMLTALIRNRRPAGEFTLVAPTKDIADLAFAQAAGAIQLDETLNDLFHHQRHIRRITHRTMESVLLVKAAGEDVVTGGKSVGTLLDETHVFATKSRAAEVFVEIRGSLGKRPDGFFAQISTQSKRPPAGVFKDELHRARDVRDGKRDLPLLAVLYEFPERIAKSEAWRDRKFWPLVNPNLNKSISADYIARQLDDAHRKGPDQMALIASQHLNVEIGIGLRTDRWPGAEYWEGQGDPDLTLDELLACSEVAVVGIDGGGLDDLFGLAVLGRDRKTKDWLAWAHAWCHEGVLARRQTIADTLRGYAEAGELTIVDDRLEDLEQIVDVVRRVKDAGVLAVVAVDPAGLGELVDALAAIDVTQENGLLGGVQQGFALMNAIKTSERRLANKTLWHNGSGLMAWCVGNLKIEPTATAIRATKQNAGDAKIDPVMALFDAASEMAKNPEASGTPIAVWA